MNLSAEYPELRADLVALPRRSRAARMRHLAAVGLAVLRGGGLAIAIGAASAPEPETADLRRRSRLAEKLGRVDE